MIRLPALVWVLGTLLYLIDREDFEKTIEEMRREGLL